MSTHHLWYLGRIDLSFLSYVNVILAWSLVGFSLGSDMGLVSLFFFGFAVFVSGLTLMGGRVMGRLAEYSDSREQ